MARAQVPTAVAAFNSLVSSALTGTTTAAIGVSINASDGMYIQTNGEQERILLFVNHNVATSQAMTIEAGVAPPAWKTKNVTLSLPATNAQNSNYVFIGPFESAAFSQSASAGTSGSAGDILLDFATAARGTIWGVLLPKGAGG